MSADTYTEIEIASSPEHVREVFLDFAEYPSWTSSFFKAITATPSNSSSPAPLQPGSTLHVILSAGFTFSPTILTNTPSEFIWRGSLPLLVHGDHYFRFEPTPSGTKFVQGEKWSGLLAWIFGPYLGGEKQARGFERFNRDLKERAESLFPAEDER